MRFLQILQKRHKRWLFQSAHKYLSSVDPQKPIVSSQKKALTSFRRAARYSKGYRRMLDDLELNPARIKNIEDFSKLVPIVDKETIFGCASIGDLCIGDARSYWSSSGSTGNYSFGAEAKKNSKKVAQSVDFLADSLFGALTRKTLFFNCIPMSWNIPSQVMAVASTGVRSDVVTALVDKLQREYEQIVIAAEAPFLKKLIEDGADLGLNWKKINVHFITGGDYVAESLRDYLAQLVGIDLGNKETGSLLINMGMSEIGNTIFCENFKTMLIRREARNNPKLRETLFGEKADTCPAVMQYFPTMNYLETVQNDEGISELVATTLGSDRTLPLVRYNTKDSVELISYEKMKSILFDFGLESLMPDHKLPFGLVTGKQQPGEISSRQIKEALFSDFELASKVTGAFFIEKDARQILVQLKPEIKTEQVQIKKLNKMLNTKIVVLPYRDYPYGMTMDYERKIRYS